MIIRVHLDGDGAVNFTPVPDQDEDEHQQDDQSADETIGEILKFTT